MISFIAALIPLTIAPVEIEIEGKKAEVLQITQPDGTPGLRLKKGDTFEVQLNNHLQDPSSIH